MIEPSASDIEKVASQIHFSPIFESMVAGEFKIFESDYYVDVIIQLNDGETPLTSVLEKQSLTIKTSSSSARINLPENCNSSNVKKISSKYYQNIVTCRIEFIL